LTHKHLIFSIHKFQIWPIEKYCNSRNPIMWVHMHTIFFFYLRGCPGQLARTTTNPTAHWTPCKPSGHVRHSGDDRRAHENSNPGAAGEDKPLLPPRPRPSVHMHTILEGLIDQRVNTRASRGTIRFYQQYLVFSTPKFILKLRRMILVISAFNWVYLYIWFKFCISTPFLFFNVITLS
jgi:hypothetical protein